MAQGSAHQGVSGTIDAFNFIRRIGFPSTPQVVSIFITITGLAGIISFPLSGLSLSSTLLVIVIAMALPTLAGEALSSTVLLRGNPVLNFRRLMGMEVIAWSSALVFLPFFALLGRLLGNDAFWLESIVIVLATSLPVRFLTVFGMSNLDPFRKVAACILVPSSSTALLLAVFYLEELSVNPVEGLIPGLAWPIVPALLVLLGCATVAGVGVARIIRRVDTLGSPVIGDSPMGLFRDFLIHWLKGDGEPLEDRLAGLGREGAINVSTLSLEGAGGLRTSVIVSNFHPGPYRDLGSGGLPSMLKSSIERGRGSTVMVPHGISNHEYNIISHKDILRLINETIAKYPSANNHLGGSILVRETSGDAKATAQIFGDTALLTLTLAPADMEDIPSQVQEAVDVVAEEKGLNVLVADAHNSLENQISISPNQAQMLQDAAIKALNSASKLPRWPLRIGAASDTLREFKIEDGIGPGGVTVLVVECQGQRVAYVTIDGNNMQSGFRQTLLESMRSEGVVDGEIMTTDTHLVAGLVRSRLGYHPVGEGLDKDLLASKIRNTVRTAVKGTQEGSSGFVQFSLDLKVLGSASFQGITSFVGHVARGIGRSFLRLELGVLVLSILILAVA